MAVERVDFYSDEDYEFALQAEMELHKQWREEQEIQQQIAEQMEEELENK